MSATVLVVDDSRMIRLQVSRALTAGGFVPIDATDGADGLQKLTASPETRLIVCDVNMPVMGGIEFLEELNTRGVAVPVLILTTDGHPAIIQRAKALGAKGWIIKPFKPELLVATARKLTTVAA